LRLLQDIASRPLELHNWVRTFLKESSYFNSIPIRFHGISIKFRPTKGQLPLKEIFGVFKFSKTNEVFERISALASK
jgi:hypothetical protein